MKLRVVGWTYYDEDMPSGDCGWAARNAIIDDIRAHGYSFSGWSHQERSRGTPVLNDGKKYCYSQRGWGDIMAEAYGEEGMFDYADFAFALDTSKEKMPSASIDKVKPEKDLNERFTLEVSREDFDRAANEHTLKLSEYEAFRYLYVGDTLALTCEGQSAEYTVTAIQRKKDATDEQLSDLTYRIVYAKLSAEERALANQEFLNIPLALFIELA